MWKSRTLPRSTFSFSMDGRIVILKQRQTEQMFFLKSSNNRKKKKVPKNKYGRFQIMFFQKVMQEKNFFFLKIPQYQIKCEFV